MTRQRVDPRSFLQTPGAVAVRADAAAFFGILSPTYQLPADQAALVTQEDGSVKLAARGDVSGRGARELVLARVSPITVTIEDLSFTSADAFACKATVSFRVSAVAESGELRSLCRVFLADKRAVTVADLACYFHPPVWRALEAIADDHRADWLTDAGNVEVISREIPRRIEGAAFESGLALEGGVNVRIHSPAYRQALLHRAQTRRRRERFDARRRIELAEREARSARAEQLATLLAKLRNQAERTPGVGVNDLIRSFSGDDRGALYQALFTADDESEHATAWITVACGSELLFFDAARPDEPKRAIAMPPTLGPIRSVQLLQLPDGAARLFVGAARGVHELPADAHAPVCSYAVVADAQLRGGVNSVAVAGDDMFATHSELGLIRWRCHAPDTQPAVLFEELTAPARTVRAVQFCDGRLVFAVDDGVYTWLVLDDEPIRLASAGATVTALCATGNGVYIGNADGDLLFAPWETGAPSVRLQAGRRRAVESIHLMDDGSVPRLFFTDTSLAVHARVIDDAFTCRYEATGQTILRAEAAPDIVVGTNETRDRLLCWKTHQPGAPCSVVPVGRLTGRSVQDVCLIPADA